MFQNMQFRKPSKDANAVLCKILISSILGAVRPCWTTVVCIIITSKNSLQLLLSVKCNILKHIFGVQ